jgi:hypothetical protein
VRHDLLSFEDYPLPSEAPLELVPTRLPPSELAVPALHLRKAKLTLLRGLQTATLSAPCRGLGSLLSPSPILLQGLDHSTTDERVGIWESEQLLTDRLRQLEGHLHEVVSTA